MSVAIPVQSAGQFKETVGVGLTTTLVFAVVSHAAVLLGVKT